MGGWGFLYGRREVVCFDALEQDLHVRVCRANVLQKGNACEGALALPHFCDVL